MSTLVINLLLLAGFVVIHLFAGRLHFLHVTPRSRWLSFAGGASVAYVFMHLLPELEEAQAQFARAVGGGEWLEHAVYLLALAGLLLFYGLERAVKMSQSGSETERDGHRGETTASHGVFWLHMVSFALYNAIIGFLLASGELGGLRQQLAFFLAMGLHFTVNDYGLHADHRDAYAHAGRWVLAAAIVAGWLLGIADAATEIIARLLFAFIAGGVILNVMKEELPKERQSRLGSFIAGALLYAGLLVMM